MCKILICIVLMLTGCSSLYNPKKPLYQMKYGIIPVKVNHPKRAINPIQDAKECLVIQGYEKLQKGISIALIATIVSLAFSNKLLHTMSSVGMGLGGYLCLDGLIKIFLAQYLTYFCFGAFAFVVIGLLVYLRKQSVFRSWNWIKGEFRGLFRKR